MRLADKRVVVTGASGIAAASARLFARHGAAVHVISQEEGECRDLVSGIEAAGGTAGSSVADLTAEEETVRSFEEAGASGPIDGLFAVAGGSGRSIGDGPVGDVPLEGWVGTQEMNLVPPFLAAREAIRSMMAGGDGGSLVLVGSVLATRPSPRLFATHSYAAAKGAIEALVVAAASRYAEHRIRVNCVAPGLVRTPMARRAAEDPETARYAKRKQPLAAGFLEPEAIGQAAMFLLSDEASMVTGQVLAVDGGWGVTEAGH